MTTRDIPFHTSPFAHLASLVSEALRGPTPGSRGSAPEMPARSRSSWLERLDHWLWDQRQRDTEAYLAQSSDLADLERRLRDIDRHIASRYY
jgi:Protein of unknown function (DUF3563)